MTRLPSRLADPAYLRRSGSSGRPERADGVSPAFNRIALTGVSRHFGRRRAVNQVSLTISSGDILGLLGPNGAGKSTLIGMLATLVAPSAGTIAYGTLTSASEGPRIRQAIGLLAHDLHLYPELSARQNLSFFARLYGLNPDAVVPAALQSANLSERADDDVAAFSRGMRQRLALERALLHGPTLVLLDEPFTGLDDRAVTIVSDRLRRLADAGAILVVATHDLDVADGLVTRVAIVRDGRLISDEPAGSGLRSRYRALVGHA
jgi:ABC-type multidrug transport system ATPase subunit